MSSDDFKWGDEDTVIPSVSAVAVYKNPNGDVVIRQENSLDDDSVIVIPLCYVESIAVRLQSILSGK